MNRIKEIRTEKELSLDEVAKACIPPTTAKQIQRLEKGERELTFQWIKRLQPALKVEFYEILPGLLSPKMKKLMALHDQLAKQEQDAVWLRIGQSLIDE